MTALFGLDIDPAKGTPEEEQCAFTRDVLRLLMADPLAPRLRKTLMRERDPASVLLLACTDNPMAKLKAQGERGAVELLCDGQQCVIHGWHPRSLSGAPVRWHWRDDRAPWNVPVSELPTIRDDDLKAMMRRISASGVLGDSPTRPPNTTVVAAPTRASAYAATARLNGLFDKHNGLVKPAIRELVRQVGAEGGGRHDAVVAICGRLVLQRWSDEQAVEFLAPIVNEHFGDGDWTGEIDAALAHARKREAERSSSVRRAAWR